MRVNTSPFQIPGRQNGCLCNLCKHRHGEDETERFLRPQILTCDAFPDGIPEEIAIGPEEHTRPSPGDHGLRFEPRVGYEGMVPGLLELLNHRDRWEPTTEGAEGPVFSSDADKWDEWDPFTEDDEDEADWEAPRKDPENDEDAV